MKHQLAPVPVIIAPTLYAQGENVYVLSARSENGLPILKKRESETKPPTSSTSQKSGTNSDWLTSSVSLRVGIALGLVVIALAKWWTISYQSKSVGNADSIQRTYKHSATDATARSERGNQNYMARSLGAMP